MSVCSETFIILSDISCRKRSEEFIIRAYKGGAKEATHKSTLRYWRNYLTVKESFPSRWFLVDNCSSFEFHFELSCDI